MKYLYKITLANKIIALLLLVLLVGSTVACSPGQESSQTSLSNQDHLVDPNFRSFYLFCGGYDLLGPAISEKIIEGNTEVQYTEAAKMIFDPQAPDKQFFRLAPLGAALVVPEPGVAQPLDGDSLYVAGHIVPEFFVETYTKLGKILGNPLGEAHKNPENGLFEQIFENMGLTYDPATDKVGSLALGVAMCNESCRTKEPEVSRHLQIYPIDPTFVPIVEKLGGDFTGYPITPGYYTPEGRWQQIFENVVFSVQAPNHPDTLIIEPIGQKLPFVSDPPRPYNGDPFMQPYGLPGEPGYDIPLYFWEYFLAHGGEAILGAPISQLHQFNDQTYVQCFKNLCLEYDLTAVESRLVHPVGLGYPYKTMFGPVEPGFVAPSVPTPTPEPSPTPQRSTLTLQAWDSLRALDTRLQQEIGVYVTLNHAPMSGIVPTLYLNLPDGNLVTHLFPPTNMDGKSVLRLPLLQGENGDFVVYAVCVDGLGSQQFCIEDTFLIWNNP